MIPTWRCSEVLDLALLTSLLVARTFLSIYVSTLQGRIVKGMIKMDWNIFIKRLISLAMCAVPASFVNSALEFFNKRLAIGFRKRLTLHFHDRYLKNMIYYQVKTWRKYSLRWYSWLILIREFRILIKE